MTAADPRPPPPPRDVLFEKVQALPEDMLRHVLSYVRHAHDNKSLERALSDPDAPATTRLYGLSEDWDTSRVTDEELLDVLEVYRLTSGFGVGVFIPL